MAGLIEQALLKPSIYDKCQALAAALNENTNVRVSIVKHCRRLRTCF